MSEQGPNRGGPASAEHAAQAPHLAEAATVRIEERLQSLFTLPDSPEEFTIGAASGYLEASKTSLLLALHDKCLIAATAGDADAPVHSLRARSIGLQLSRQQLLDMNRHPFMRTRSTEELSHSLRTSVQELNNIARKHKLVPITRRAAYRNAKESDPSFYYGYFDLDQQAMIQEVVGQTLPEIPRPILVSDICKELELSDQDFSELQTFVGFELTSMSGSNHPAEKKRSLPHIQPETAIELRIALDSFRAWQEQRDAILPQAPQGTVDQEQAECAA